MKDLSKEPEPQTSPHDNIEAIQSAASASWSEQESSPANCFFYLKFYLISLGPETNFLILFSPRAVPLFKSLEKKIDREAIENSTGSVKKPDATPMRKCEKTGENGEKFREKICTNIFS